MLIGALLVLVMAVADAGIGDVAIELTIAIVCRFYCRLVRSIIADIALNEVYGIAQLFRIVGMWPTAIKDGATRALPYKGFDDCEAEAGCTTSQVDILVL